MSKTTGSKVSIDKNTSFARFALCRGNYISRWTDRGFNTPIRQKEKSFWFTGSLVTGLEIISVESPDTMGPDALGKFLFILQKKLSQVASDKCAR